MTIKLLIEGKEALFDDEDYHLIQDKKLRLHANTKRAKLWGVVYYDNISQNTRAIHRLILGAKKGEVVDHINHNVMDNRKRNIRICTIAENCRNRILKINSSHNYKGISIDTRWNTPRYRAEIVSNYKKITIGHFDRPELAGLAYDIFALKYFGEFASLNFPHLKASNLWD